MALVGGQTLAVIHLLFLTQRLVGYDLGQVISSLSPAPSEHTVLIAASEYYTKVKRLDETT